MSSRLEAGGRKDKEAFLSAHRCPEDDLLPHHTSETQILPPGSVSADPKQPEVSSAGQPDSNYLDVSSTPHCHEDEDGSVSDWSEEDLSLHFSPSVIISSEDEESEGTFECVDITMETLVNGQEGEGPKMVPKRQIQLKKKEEENMKEKKLQVRNDPAGGKDGSNEALSPRTRQRPDLLLRQHSMPASTTSGDADSYRVYRGLIAGANQGLHVGGSTKQRLQKSFSLDETKTKMASGIIKSVLSKKMQAEQGGCKTPHVQNKASVAPNLPQAAEQQRAREGGGGGGGGGEAGGGVPKAPIHVVRDMRSLVKNTYSHTFSAPQNSKPLSFKVVGQGGSPPPTYQQAVGVKVHNQSKNPVRGTAKQVAGSLVQSQQRNQRNRPSHPITEQRRGSQPITGRPKQDDVIIPAASGVSTKSPDVNTPPKSRTSEKAGAGGPKVGAPRPPSEVTQPPACAPPSSRPPEATQPLLTSQEQSAVLGVPSPFVPGNPQQIFQPCFFAPAALPPFAPTVLRHLGKVSYVQAPLNYLPSQLQPGLHLLRTPEDNQSGLPGTPPHLRTEDQKSNSAIATPARQERPEQPAENQHLQPQQPLLPCLQGFLPVQSCTDALQDAANPAASTPGVLSHAPTPSHILDPPNLQCFYVDVATQPQRKMLLDPETGQYVQVFLPAPSTTPVGLASPAPYAPAAVKAAPAILSVMQFQPTIAVSPLYAPPFLPFPLNAPSVNFTHAPL